MILRQMYVASAVMGGKMRMASSRGGVLVFQQHSDSAVAVEIIRKYL